MSGETSGKTHHHVSCTRRRQTHRCTVVTRQLVTERCTSEVPRTNLRFPNQSAKSFLLIEKARGKKKRPTSCVQLSLGNLGSRPRANHAVAQRNVAYVSNSESDSSVYFVFLDLEKQKITTTRNRRLQAWARLPV